LLRQVTRQGDDRWRGLDERLKRLAELRIGHFGGGKASTPSSQVVVTTAAA